MTKTFVYTIDSFQWKFVSTNDKFMEKNLSKSLNYVLPKCVSNFWYFASFFICDRFLKKGSCNPSPYLNVKKMTQPHNLPMTYLRYDHSKHHQLLRGLPPLSLCWSLVIWYYICPKGPATLHLVGKFIR